LFPYTTLFRSTLRQRVVNLARQPRALLQYQRKPRSDLTQTELINRPRPCHDRGQAKGAEPRGLPKLREHFEFVGLLAAGPAGQFGTDVKSVVPVTQAVEIDHPPPAG